MRNICCLFEDCIVKESQKYLDNYNNKYKIVHKIFQITWIADSEHVIYLVSAQTVSLAEQVLIPLDERK